MNFLSFIESKRDGESLSAEQLREIVSGAVEGKIPDYQLAAFFKIVHAFSTCSIWDRAQSMVSLEMTRSIAPSTIGCSIVKN